MGPILSHYFCHLLPVLHSRYTQFIVDAADPTSNPRQPLAERKTAEALALKEAVTTSNAKLIGGSQDGSETEREGDFCLQTRRDAAVEHGITTERCCSVTPGRPLPLSTTHQKEDPQDDLLSTHHT